MIKLYHAPLTRSVRVLWLLEELGLPYALEVSEMQPPTPKPFAQKTPTGKFPTIEDGETTLFESGAIVEYILERYGDGRLAPAPDAPDRGAFLQWVHFAESTAFAGLGNLAWHIRFREDADRVPEAIADYRGWAMASLDAPEQALGDGDYILGADFSAADVMLGYTLLVARAFGVLGDAHPKVNRYLDRLVARPGFQKALAS